MSTQRTELIPEWTLGDRLRKARSLTGMSVREFAEHIGVSHGTITNAEHDARGVRPITMKAWALATGVSIEWLETGASTNTQPPPPSGTRTDSLDALTARKRSRGRATRGSADTHRYPSAA